MNDMINAESEKLVNYIFTKFMLLFRGFNNIFDDQNMFKAEKAQWASTFTRLGINKISQVEKGLLKAETYEYPNPPQLGMFLKWCETTPEDHKFMTKEQAYRKAYEFMRDGDTTGMSDDQVTILTHAITESDRFFLKNSSIDKTQPVFYRNYEIAVKQFMDGEIKPIPKAIDGPQQDDDPWKTLKKYGGVLPQYAHLTSRDEAMPVIQELLKKNGGSILKKVPK